ncbi:UNVERIFIED_CONTAM: protein TONNEAU 1b [Sesamum radiatum]|uniref:Protein TONNEAU 1b n=1 Tax=Sesamum radiatum TaxID=300843 RepID=A0AAW2N8D8_SESRA
MIQQIKKGVLAKIWVGLRASVFEAIEEEDRVVKKEEMMDLGTPITHTLEKKDIFSKTRAELRAGLFEAIEEEDRVVEKEELPPALLGSCSDRAKQLHNSLSYNTKRLTTGHAGSLSNMRRSLSSSSTCRRICTSTTKNLSQARGSNRRGPGDAESLPNMRRSLSSSSMGRTMFTSTR